MARSKKILDKVSLKEALVEKICTPIIKEFPSLSDLVIVGIYTRGVYLANRVRDFIFKKTGVKLPLGEIDINLYRDDFVRRFDFPQVRRTDIPDGVQDKGVILVDDVLFTGRTVRAALDVILDVGRPKFIKLAVLVSRPGREMPVCPDYVGLDVDVSEDKRVYVQLREVDGADQVVIR